MKQDEKYHEETLPPNYTEDPAVKGACLWVGSSAFSALPLQFILSTSNGGDGPSPGVLEPFSLFYRTPQDLEGMRL